MRGDTSSAFGPNTGTICRFSVRYWMNTTPRLNGSAKGASTTIFAAGCSSSDPLFSDASRLVYSTTAIISISTIASG